MKKLIKIRPAICLSAAVLFLLTLYGPAEVYLSNMDDFTYDFWDVLLYMLPVCIVLLLFASLLFLLAKKVSSKLYQILLVCGFSLLIAFYVQGNFLSGNLPAMDGRPVDWSEFDYQRLYSVILLFVSLVLAVCFRLFKKNGFEKIVELVSCLVIAFLSLSLVLSAIPENGFKTRNQIAVSKEGLFSVGREENFIIFLLDAVDGDEAERIIEEYPVYSEGFKDFTFFPNTLGAYPFTQYAIPFIFSGEWYENKEPFYDYKERAFSNSPFLLKLKSCDYDLGVYEESLPVSYEVTGDFSNTELISTRLFVSPSQFIKTQLKLSFYKYLPYDLKRYCHITPNDIYTNSLKQTGSIEDVFSWSNGDFYNTLCNSEFSVEDGKRFIYIHLEGGHYPYGYNPEMVPDDNASYSDILRAGFKIVLTYLQNLKDIGAYDRTAVVIMADHGFGVNGHGRQNPIFMVKGINEDHPFKVNEAPISYADLQSIFSRVIDQYPADECTDYKAGDSRERRYLDSEYLHEDEIYEYIQYGYATDDSSMLPTGNAYFWRR